MKKIIKRFRSDFLKYELYRRYVIDGRTLGMMFLTGIFTVYAVIAPLFVNKIVPGQNNSLIHMEFTLLSLVCGIAFVGFTVLHLFKNMKYSIKSVLYETLMALLCIATAGFYPHYALYQIYLQDAYPDYAVFYIIALIMLITFVMNPFHFLLCYIGSAISMASLMTNVGIYESKQIYNFYIFNIIVIILYYVQYRSRIVAHLRGEKIIEMQKQREDYMVQLTHEMRTPLNAILGKNQMILADTAEENTRKLSGQINGSGRLLLSLINDMLDRSKIESGKMNVVISEYKSAHLVEEISSIVDTMAEEHGLLFEKEISSKVPAYLTGDEIRIQQIILNLLSNAIKYTPSGKVTLHMDFDASNENEGILKVAVSDTGIGIKSEDFPKLTQSFVRVDELNNKGIQGTGLGLSITQNLLQLMGSCLKVESTYGEGSTFSFDLRQTYSQKEEEHQSEVSDQINSYPDAKILIVDDNRINISVLKGLLIKNQIVPDSALSGQACLDNVSDTHYDIIFLDHMMPEMNGIDTLQHLRQEYADCIKDTRIVALTANYDSNAKSTYASYGFDDYLAKPVETKVLNELLNTYLK